MLYYKYGSTSEKQRTDEVWYHQSENRLAMIILMKLTPRSSPDGDQVTWSLSRRLRSCARCRRWGGSGTATSSFSAGLLDLIVYFICDWNSVDSIMMGLAEPLCQAHAAPFRHSSQRDRLTWSCASWEEWFEMNFSISNNSNNINTKHQSRLLKGVKRERVNK